MQVEETLDLIGIDLARAVQVNRSESLGDFVWEFVKRNTLEMCDQEVIQLLRHFASGTQRGISSPFLPLWVNPIEVWACVRGKREGGRKGGYVCERVSEWE
jgi:hypothetical protein